MTIPISMGAGPLPHVGAAQVWRWLWRGWLATLRAQQPEPDAAATRTDAARECSSFVDLFTRYHLALIDYLYGMTRDRELAADLAQDAFTRAYAAAPELAGIAQPRAWLYRIATNVALNARQRQRRFAWLPLSRIEPEAGMETGAEAGEAWSALPPVAILQSKNDPGVSVAERDAVWTVLAELPPRWRAILLLQATAGFEVREIAALLHLSESNVRVCHFRAKERFRALYREQDAEGAAR
jgi:RNA polymerase sigma-70 factor (ECF subfamily)